jgi:flavin reductase (DIM6/NTAB) family NADH-FMN oxidoreductase RutF
LELTINPALVVLSVVIQGFRYLCGAKAIIRLRNSVQIERRNEMEKKKIGPEPLILPMPALIVGANVNGRPNFMIASWCGIAAFKPPAITVAMNKVRYTLRGIKENGTFSVNIPSCEDLKKTDYCGIYSGKKRDKSQIFDTFYGELKSAPLVRECPVNLECRALHYLDMKSHTLIVGEIIETHITKSCLTDGEVDPGKIDPPVYIRNTMKYHRLGEVVASAFNVGKEHDDARSPETILTNMINQRSD